MTDDQKDLDDLKKRVELLEKENARYKGFVGGVVFVCVSLWAFIELIFPYIKVKLGT